MQLANFSVVPLTTSLGYKKVLGGEEVLSPFYRTSETGKKYRKAEVMQRISIHCSFRRKIKPQQDLL